MKLALILTYLLNLFDLAYTMDMVNTFGIETEANPIGRHLLSSNLAIPFKVFGVGACLITLYACIKRKPEYKWVGWIPLAVYSLLAIYHIIIKEVLP